MVCVCVCVWGGGDPDIVTAARVSGTWYVCVCVCGGGVIQT